MTTPLAERLGALVARWRGDAHAISELAEPGKLWSHQKTEMDALTRCATELEALAAAGHEGWLRVGWWLDGPKRSELVFKDVEPDAAIARICAETGDDPEDYTATSVHAQTFSADLGFDSPADQEHRRLATQPGSAGWMPIESAPMDGTRVLLWHDSYRTPMAGYGLTRDDGDMWNVNGTTAHESLRARCPARGCMPRRPTGSRSQPRQPPSLRAMCGRAAPTLRAGRGKEMAKPIRKSITVWRKTFPDGKEPFNVEAEVIGPFGIYPTFGYSKRGLWTVCHAATGYAVTCNVRGVGAARELCRLLRRLPVWDFDQADAVKNIDPQTVRLIKTHARASHPVWMQAAEADPAPESR